MESFIIYSYAPRVQPIRQNYGGRVYKRLSNTILQLAMAIGGEDQIE